MHKFSCKAGDQIQIDLPGDLDPRTPIGLLFARGAIEVRVIHVKNDEVKLAVSAHARFRMVHQKDND